MSFKIENVILHDVITRCEASQHEVRVRAEWTPGRDADPRPSGYGGVWPTFTASERALGDYGALAMTA